MPGDAVMTEFTPRGSGKRYRITPEGADLPPSRTLSHTFSLSLEALLSSPDICSYAMHAEICQAMPYAEPCQAVPSITKQALLGDAELG